MFFSENPADELTEPFRVFAYPLFSELTPDSVSVTDLRNEFFSDTVELEPNEALRYNV